MRKPLLGLDLGPWQVGLGALGLPYTWSVPPTLVLAQQRPCPTLEAWRLPERLLPGLTQVRMDQGQERVPRPGECSQGDSYEH